MRYTTLLCAVTCCIMLTGCQPLAKMVFGIRMIDHYEEKDCLSFLEESRKYLECTQIVSSREQFDSVIRLDTSEAMMQHLGQPVQVHYFDGDSATSFLVQCYAQSGMFSVDWNHGGWFDSFPPASSVPEAFGHLTLDRYRDIYPDLKPTRRRTILIFWNNVLRSVSMKAVKAVAQNIAGHEAECQVVLVNTDQWMAYYINESKKKR